uniref:Rubredoxin-like domain-containing protein n=1 Tax=Skeletonema marinoi TaxID=267567 RepID=A0A7S2L1A9_9STRA
MRSLVAVTSVATYAAFLHTSCAFTAPRAAPLIVASPHRSPSITASFATGNNDADAAFHDEIELVPSLQQLKQSKQQISDDTTAASSTTRRQRIQSKLLQLYERTNTLKAAGLYNNKDPNLQPLQSGFKSNVGILVGAFLFKWYRARFINKIPVWDRQPQWNMVVTSPEQEKELHAYSCKSCGATIFIARHREWFFKGGNTECTNCGATGIDNFEDIRGDVIDSIDDDYFDYESPLDFVSAAERRKLVKQAGGDEDLAKQIAIDNVMKNDKEQIQLDETTASSSSKKDKKKKKKKRSNDDAAPAQESAPKKKKEKTEEDDIFDELDMDM